MDDVLRLDGHQALDDLLQDEACLNFWKIAHAHLEEAINVATVAQLLDQIVVRLSFGARDQAHHVAVLNFRHNFDLVNQ